jgi:type VI secretion system protein ImpM
VSGEVAIGWFGKLPCAGDFVYRRLPYAVVDAVDQWLRRGLAELRAAEPANWRQVYGDAPIWNCAVPARSTGTGMTLIGLLAPSRDRVGREFPLCAGLALPESRTAGAFLAASHEWLATLGRLVIEARARPTTLDAFDDAVQRIALPTSVSSGLPSSGGDDILSILNSTSEDVPTVPMPLAHTLPWPDLPREFDPDAGTSYWWTNTADGAALRGFTTDSGLAPSLLLTLMRVQAAAPRRS